MVNDSPARPQGGDQSLRQNEYDQTETLAESSLPGRRLEKYFERSLVFAGLAAALAALSRSQLIVAATFFLATIVMLGGFVVKQRKGLRWPLWISAVVAAALVGSAVWLLVTPSPSNVARGEEA